MSDRIIHNSLNDVRIVGERKEHVVPYAGLVPEQAGLPNTRVLDTYWDHDRNVGVEIETDLGTVVSMTNVVPLPIV